jgi:hypothetical protein
MKHWIRTFPFLLAGAVSLGACTYDEPAEDNPTTVTTATTTTDGPDIGIPGGRFLEQIAAVPETDPAPYSSALIFPEQPGLQFQGPDGTYCEMYSGGDASALCTYDGEGDINAVSVREGQPARTHNVNRIFAPGGQTAVLEPGNRLVEGPVSCAIAEGEVTVMCAIDPYSFTVSRDDVELG